MRNGLETEEMESRWELVSLHTYPDLLEDALVKKTTHTHTHTHTATIGPEMGEN